MALIGKGVLYIGGMRVDAWCADPAAIRIKVVPLDKKTKFIKRIIDDLKKERN